MRPAMPARAILVVALNALEAEAHYIRKHRLFSLSLTAANLASLLLGQEDDDHRAAKRSENSHASTKQASGRTRSCSTNP